MDFSKTQAKEIIKSALKMVAYLYNIKLRKTKCNSIGHQTLTKFKNAKMSAANHLISIICFPNKYTISHQIV